MKKKSRFLTGLLSAVMALSLFALPAAALETTTSTIDRTKTGSITIHKYLMDNTDDANKNPTGEIADEDNLPEGAKPAANVGFTIYQVMDTDALLKYYDSKGEDTRPSASSYIDKDGKVKSDYAKAITDAKGQTVADVNAQKLTGNDGTATFTGLPVGLYLVVETYKPDTVVTAVDPFLISVPMTRVSTETDAQKQWMYDINVYPKNGTHTGDIKLVKKGVIGSDKDNTTLLSGVQFTLERLKDGSNPEVWEPVNGTDANANSNVYTTKDGEITVKSLMPGTYRFKEIGYSSDAKDTKYIINKDEYYYFTINDKGEVNGDDTAANKNDYTAADTTVTVYNYAPDIDKQVQKRDDSAEKTWQEAADYNVGDMVPYKITVTVPSNIAKLKTFKVTDTPTNLEDTINTIKVSGEGVAANMYTLPTTNNDDGGFTIEFHPDMMTAVAGKTLTIEYEAKLLDQAVTTTDGNLNQAKLIYSNKTNKEDEEEDKDWNQRGDEAVVYTFKLKVIKESDVADENGNKALAGVKFDLYKEVKSSEVPEGVTPLNVAEATRLGLPAAKGDYVWICVKKDLITKADGTIEVSGLANGTYYLVETETKKGYNLLKSAVEVKIDIAYKTTWSYEDHYKDGVLVKSDVTQKDEKFDKDEQGTTNGGTQSGTRDDKNTVIGVKSVKVINRKGFDLPTTGGFGTLLFSGIGALLVVGGVGVLMSIKKKKGNV